MMGEPEPEGESVSVDTSVPHIARVYDYWLGGKVAAFFAGLDLVEPGLVQLHGLGQCLLERHPGHHSG